MRSLSTRVSGLVYLRQAFQGRPSPQNPACLRITSSGSGANLSCLCLALSLVLPRVTAGQAGNEARTALILYGGLAVGQRLSTVRQQPLCVLMTVPGGYQCEQGGSGPVNDTLTISRKVGAGELLGIGLVMFPRGHLGFRGEIFYMHHSLENQCAPNSAFQPDSQAKNQQVCDDFSATNSETNTVGRGGSLVLRAAPGKMISPYIRVGTGVGIRWGEVLAVAGNFSDQGRPLERSIVRDSNAQSLTGFLTTAVGLTSGSQGASFRVELGDIYSPIERATGPADASGHAPHSSVWRHSLSLVLGVDIVLDFKSGHRY